VFTSLERRPAFSLNEAANQTLTNRQFGMQLRVRGRAAADRQTLLGWEGGFSWSSDLVDLWAGDKYLMFGMRVAKILKPGMLYSEGGDDDDDGSNQKGVNLRTLFGKKKKEETKSPAAPVPANVSFLSTDFQQVKFDGGQMVRENEWPSSVFRGARIRIPRKPSICSSSRYFD